MKRLPMTPDNYRLVLDGKKDVTRRLINPQVDGKLRRPYYTPGEIVVIVTRWAVSSLYDNLKPKKLRSDIMVWVSGVVGCAVWPDDDTPKKWRPARFIPLHLEYQFPKVEILSVRVERLQDITKEDAIREGISVLPLQSVDDPSAWYQSAPGVHQARSAVQSYRLLWDSINKKSENKWAANPWVFRYEFEVV